MSTYPASEEEISDFEHRFTYSLAASGMGSVVIFTDACMKASTAVAKIFSNGKHFGCYWHAAKNVAKKLKGVLGNDTSAELVRLMGGAHRRVSIVVFQQILNVEIPVNTIFSRRHTYFSGTWREDKVQRCTLCSHRKLWTRGDYPRTTGGGDP